MNPHGTADITKPKKDKTKPIAYHMMTSSNGNIFHVTGHLCGEFTSPPRGVNSPHKGHWCGALMFSLICVWINGWVNNRQAGDLRRCRTNFDVIVMKPCAHFKRYRVSPALSSSGEVLEDSGRDWKVNSGLSCHRGLTLADSRLTGPWRLPLLALVWHWNHSILGQIDMGRIWNLRFIV